MTAPIIPGSTAGDHRPMRLVRPFQDPANTFRAHMVTEMFYVVPNREKFSQFVFDVGIDPKVKPYIFSIQNRSINTALRCKLTLPPYLRSSLGDTFDIPFVGDTQTHPIQLSDPASGSFGTGTGKGLINIVVSFSEEQAKTLFPPGQDDAIVFDFYPRDTLTSPIFIDSTIAPPQDLNGVIITGSVPVDNDVPPETTVPTVVKIPVYVTQSVEIPVAAAYWRNGVEITVDGTLYSADSLVPGSPPVGWHYEADGRAYPPLPSNPCDPSGATGAGGIAGGQNTPLQALVLAASKLPPTFGTQTVRRGYVIDVLPFFTGDQTNRIARTEPQFIVADGISGDTKFKIIKTGGYNSSSLNLLPSKTDQQLVINDVNQIVSLVKEGVIPHIAFAITDDQRRVALAASKVNDVINEGKKINVSSDLSDSALLQLSIVGLASALLTEIKANGEGDPIP